MELWESNAQGFFRSMKYLLDGIADATRVAVSRTSKAAVERLEVAPRRRTQSSKIMMDEHYK